MQPLLKISSVPIKLEAQSKRASLQYSTQPPQMNITRTPGRQNIQATPAKINIDTTEARANSGLKTTQRLSQDYAQQSRAAALEATRNYVEEGNVKIDSPGGSPIADIAASKSLSPAPAPEFGPVQNPVITAQPASISFDYQMDKLTFDWNVSSRPQLEYIPASIEYSVAQYPQLIIEYVGSPIYVPASSDPNYVPPPSNK